MESNPTDEAAAVTTSSAEAIALAERIRDWQTAEWVGAAEIDSLCEQRVKAERERCFTWALGRVPRSRACRAIRDGDDPHATPKDPSRCWRCGETLHPGHYCETETERVKAAVADAVRTAADLVVRVAAPLIDEVTSIPFTDPADYRLDKFVMWREFVAAHAALRAALAGRPAPEGALETVSPSSRAVLEESLRVLGPSADGAVERDLAQSVLNGGALGTGQPGCGLLREIAEAAALHLAGYDGDLVSYPERNMSARYDRLKALLYQAGLYPPPTDAGGPGSASNTEEIKYICVNGHDHCNQMYPGPDCPYCERAPATPTASAAPDYTERARGLVADWRWSGESDEMLASRIRVALSAGVSAAAGQIHDLERTVLALQENTVLGDLRTARAERDEVLSRLARLGDPDVREAVEAALVTYLPGEIHPRYVVAGAIINTIVAKLGEATNG